MPGCRRLGRGSVSAGAFDLVVRGGKVVAKARAEIADIGIRAGRIVAIGDLAGARAAEMFDASSLHVLPGGIDTQVHFREPGLEHKEDLATGSAAAIAGGVTTVFEMPNTSPSTTDAERLADKVQRARGRMHCDHAFYVGATPENADTLAALERAPGCCGVKLFMGSSTGNLLVPDDAAIERVLAHGRRRVAVHAEDEERLRERRAAMANDATVHAHPVWRDAETAIRATRRLLALARRTARRVHVLHVTTAEELSLLASHRELASVECTPQHLSLVAPECYDRLGALAQMNPPIRDERHRRALWQAVRDGTVDVVGSDHAPHTLEEKARPYPESPSGMPGVQTLLPLLLDHAHAGRLSLARVVDLVSAGPARVFGIAGKGAIEPGCDADLAIFDLAATWCVERRWLRSRCDWSPFEGMQLRGRPIATVLRGRIAMRDDEILGPATGTPVRFVDPAMGVQHPPLG